MVATPALAQSPKYHEVRTPVAAKAYAKETIRSFGWAGKQWNCLEELWTKESNWRPDAYNKQPVYQKGKKRHAGGIPQILGLNPKSSVMTQVNRGIKYISARYSTPCSALNFHKRVGWY